jgi:tetratricopeptide (TPR) repeat protein
MLAAMTYLRAAGMGIWETLTAVGRQIGLRLARVAGTAYRLTARGWGPAVRWLAVVALGLLVIPPLVNAAFSLATRLGVWSRLEVDEPRLSNLWSVESVLGVAAAILAVRWLIRARERVVVEEFVDYTNSDAQAVKGLSTLLVTELSRLRELYGRVNDQLSTPLSVGVQRRGGTVRGTEPGAFLSVRADDVTGVLNDAIATESTVQVGGFKIPIGLLLALVGRLARGPRIIGSVHYTDAAGGPTLTAQVVGRGKSRQWRVDAPPCASTSDDKAFLDPMVTEAACRMFNDLTLRSSVRWRAITAFTAYLELYWEGLRTPKNRAANLKLAEAKLLEAVAEDETFDLAYYNLGVVYSQLAQTEYAAAQASEYVPKTNEPQLAYKARLDAARGAFARAVALNRDRWEAVYALAVHEFAHVQDAPPDDRAAQVKLDCVICRCERVLELDPRNAQAHDLQGMAHLRKGDCRPAMRSHRHAVASSWRRLRHAEFMERTAPPTMESSLPGARANTASALHNLALAHRKHADAAGGVTKPLRLARADHVFGQALALAPPATRAATLFERGILLEERERPERAMRAYMRAIKIEPDNPVYWAHLDRARASAGETFDVSIESALENLAPLFRRTLEAHPSRATVALRDNTLEALRGAYHAADDPDGRDRIDAIVALAARLQDGPDVASLGRLRTGFADRDWEREQVAIVLARTLAASKDWDATAAEYGALIAELERVRPLGVVQHSLHAKHAKALRRAKRREEALGAAARGHLLDPLSASVRRELGKAHFALLQFDEALEAWQHTLWLTPNDPNLHWKVAFCHWSVAQARRDATARREALEAARAGFSRAATLFGVRAVKGWAWSHLWAGRTAADLGDDDDAIRELRAAHGCAPTRLAAALLLGELYRSVGDNRLSRPCLLEASTLVRAEIASDRNVDRDWGETLSARELAARASVGLGLWALDVDADGDAARRFLQRANAHARATRQDVEAHARCMARVLDLESRIMDASGDVEAAAACARKAARLEPSRALAETNGHG